jgi:hypothetical protein
MTSNLGYEAPSAAPRAEGWQLPHRQAQAPQAQAPQPQPPRAHDPEAWPLIRRSAARLSRYQEAFAQQLHYDVTRLLPELAGAPAPAMWAFCERMAKTLLWVALTDQPLAVVEDTLGRVGGQNWAEGFPETQYANVTHALVQTVHYLSENDWSASLGSAWISFFMWIEPHLIAGAQQAAAEEAAARQAAERQAAEQRAAAVREAARVKALSQDPRGGHRQVVADVNLESVASLLDDEDDENVGYSQIMASMTRPHRRDSPRHTS